MKLQKNNTKFKKIKSFIYPSFSLLHRPRDFCLLQNKISNKDTITISQKSVGENTCPKESFWYSVRGEILKSGFLIRPFGESKNYSILTYILCINMKGWVPNYLSFKSKMDELKCISSIREYIHQTPFLFNQKAEEEDIEEENGIDNPIQKEIKNSSEMNPILIPIKTKEQPKSESIENKNPKIDQKKQHIQLEEKEDEEELLIESNIAYSKVARKEHKDDEDNIFNQDFDDQLHQKPNPTQSGAEQQKEEIIEEEEEENLELDEIFPPNKFTTTISQAIESLLELSYGGDWKYVDTKKNIEIFKMDIEGTSYTTVKGNYLFLLFFFFLFFYQKKKKKGVGTIKAPYGFILEFIKQIERKSEYDAMFDKGSIVKEVDEFTLIWHQMFKGQWPTTPVQHFFKFIFVIYIIINFFFFSREIFCTFLVKNNFISNF